MDIETLKNKVNNGTCFVLDPHRTGIGHPKKDFVLYLISRNALTTREIHEISGLTMGSLNTLLRKYEQEGLVSVCITGDKRLYVLTSKLNEMKTEPSDK